MYLIHELNYSSTFTTHEISKVRRLHTSFQLLSSSLYKLATKPAAPNNAPTAIIPVCAAPPVLVLVVATTSPAEFVVVKVAVEVVLALTSEVTLELMEPEISANWLLTEDEIESTREETDAETEAALVPVRVATEETTEETSESTDETIEETCDSTDETIESGMLVAEATISLISLVMLSTIPWDCEIC